jgi:hypothetical protein
VAARLQHVWFLQPLTWNRSSNRECVCLRIIHIRLYKHVWTKLVVQPIANLEQHFSMHVVESNRGHILLITRSSKRMSDFYGFRQMTCFFLTNALMYFTRVAQFCTVNVRQENFGVLKRNVCFKFFFLVTWQTVEVVYRPNRHVSVRYSTAIVVVLNLFSFVRFKNVGIFINQFKPKSNVFTTCQAADKYVVYKSVGLWSSYI